ncbi:MAG: alanine--tRNA ligase, partial [Propionibacterium sp.]|nr:alanine--tRNA ligase [Propionibacterium sp.]
EELSNEAILKNYAVTDQRMPLEEATALGAMAMFGEKYPPIVRMVELAGPWSRELCGGTHVGTTAQIGVLNLMSEQSIGSGVRRVEALVSEDAFKQFAAERSLVRELTESLRVRPEQLPERIGKLVAQLKDAEKRIADMQAEKLLSGAAQMLSDVERVGDVNLLAIEVPGVGGGDLRTLASDLRARMDAGTPGIVALVGGAEKPAAIVATNEAARDRGFKAGALIRLACTELGGKGGGKDDLAQGGGVDATKAPEALAAVRSAVADG